LALKISYANSLADLCERLGASVDEVTRGMGLDPRIGPQFLRAGLGFGGARLPSDVRGLLRLSERSGLQFAMLAEAERINQQRIDRFVEKAKRVLWVLQDKVIAVLGLAYTADSDDVRASPAIELIRRLLAEGARVSAFDPQASENARALLPAVPYAQSPYEAADGADALVIATEWPQFRTLDWKRIHSTMARPLILDGRDLLDPAAMHSLGFEYQSVGRPESHDTSGS
jgi:UDPglucose 6-dehydrogenase